MDALRKWLRKWDKPSNEIVIAGDTNFDLLKLQSHLPTQNYTDLLVSHKLLPRITLPTRIKHQSATIIDHLFTCAHIDTGIFTTELSGSYGFTDHYPIFGVIPTKPVIKQRQICVTKRYFTKEGHENRKEGLRNEDWGAFFAEGNSTILYNTLLEKYLFHYEQNITVKKCSGRWNIYTSKS